MQKKKSTEKLSINKIRDGLDAEVRKIFTEFYRKKYQENDAEVGRVLGISGSTSKYYREGMQIPGWVLLHIWRHAPELLRDRIIEKAMETDPCNNLTEEECELVHDFAAMLASRRKKTLMAQGLISEGQKLGEEFTNAISAATINTETPAHAQGSKGGSAPTSDTRNTSDTKKSEPKKRKR